MKKVLIAGASGFVGKRLKSFLEHEGYSATGLSRRTSSNSMVQWDPVKGEIPLAAIDDADVVINLAGANIAEKRWSTDRRKILRDSRICSTRTLVEAMRNCSHPPALFISMSGVNFYATGKELKSEKDPPGDMFLSGLCQEWESEALKAELSGIRTVVMRMGVVLDKSGGALKKMLPAFRVGMGGPIGSGKQGFPWISMTELMHILLFAIETPSLRGPMNVVHPDRISQGEFAQQLAKVLHRPAIFRLPGTMIRILFGQMGEETILADINVHPEKLLQCGYEFREASLRESLERMFSG